ERARRERVPVVWIQHSDDELAHGSDGWQIVSALAPGDAEPLVEKNYGDAFEDTTLGTVLFRAGCRATAGGRRADRLVRPLHAARCPGWGLQRHPRRRCAYDGRPD